MGLSSGSDDGNTKFPMMLYEAPYGSEIRQHHVATSMDPWILILAEAATYFAFLKDNAALLS